MSHTSIGVGDRYNTVHGTGTITSMDVELDRYVLTLDVNLNDGEDKKVLTSEYLFGKKIVDIEFEIGDRVEANTSKGVFRGKITEIYRDEYHQKWPYTVMDDDHKTGAFSCYRLTKVDDTVLLGEWEVKSALAATNTEIQETMDKLKRLRVSRAVLEKQLDGLDGP